MSQELEFIIRKVVVILLAGALIAGFGVFFIYQMRGLASSVKEIASDIQGIGRSKRGKVSSGSEAATLESKLAILAECGIRLAPPFSVKDLLESSDRADYEQPGWDATLVGLGMTEEREPWRNHCLNLWHFDTECIEGHGAYKAIAERMSEMARGSLPITNIRDFVDLENKKAWLAFSFRGKDVRIDCKVNDDWVDERVLTRLAGYLKQSDPDKTFVYYDLHGQDCLIGSVSRTELRCLQKNGIQFEPMA